MVENMSRERDLEVGVEWELASDGDDGENTADVTAAPEVQQAPAAAEAPGSEQGDTQVDPAITPKHGTGSAPALPETVGETSD